MRGKQIEGRVHSPAARGKKLKDTARCGAVALGAILALLLGLAGCAATPPGGSVGLSVAAPIVKIGVAEHPVKSGQAALVAPPGGRWDIARGSVLISVERGYGATVGAVTPDKRVRMSGAAAAPVDNVQASRSGPKLAYKAMPGIYPGDNYIEVAEPASGLAQQIKAAKGFAIFGFSMAPDGGEIVFSEAAVAGASSSRVPWRLLIAELRQGQVRQVMSSDKATADMGETVPVPFAWSQTTGEVYLRALRPFRGGGGEGVWAMRPDGSGLRRLLQENEFVGLPLLSPDGARLAYLASDLQALPAGFISGSGDPPGNIIQVMDLKTGQSRVISKEKDRAYGLLVWSGDGSSLITSLQDWVDSGFRDSSIEAFSASGSPMRELLKVPKESNVTGVFEYPDRGGFLWVNATVQGTRLISSSGGGPPTEIVTAPQGQIKIVGYVD